MTNIHSSRCDTLAAKQHRSYRSRALGYLFTSGWQVLHAFSSEPTAKSNLLHFCCSGWGCSDSVPSFLSPPPFSPCPFFYLLSVLLSFMSSIPCACPTPCVRPVFFPSFFFPPFATRPSQTSVAAPSFVPSHTRWTGTLTARGSYPQPLLKEEPRGGTCAGRFVRRSCNVQHPVIIDQVASRYMSSQKIQHSVSL